MKTIHRYEIDTGLDANETSTLIYILQPQNHWTPPSKALITGKQIHLIFQLFKQNGIVPKFQITSLLEAKTSKIQLTLDLCFIQIQVKSQTTKQNFEFNKYPIEHFQQSYTISKQKYKTLKLHPQNANFFKWGSLNLKH